MTKRIHIPGIIDALFISDPEATRRIDNHPRIDRIYENKGPILNRSIRSRFLSFPDETGGLWPAFRSRYDQGRQARTQSLQKKLDAQVSEQNFNEALVTELGQLLRQANPERSTIGSLMQRVVGKAFFDDFEAYPELYKDAQRLSDWVAGGFFRRLLLKLSGGPDKARKRVYDACRQNPYSAHAIALALPNLIESYFNLSELFQSGRRREHKPLDVVLSCLTGPERLIRTARPFSLEPDARLSERRANVKIDLPETKKPVTATTLIVLNRKDAQLEDGDIMFSSSSWSACPARHWVPKLLSAIWRSAIAEGTQSS